MLRFQILRRRTMRLSIAVAFIVSVLGCISNAAAETLQTIVVSATQPSSTSCVEPPPQTSFPATGGSIYEYFVIQNMSAGDIVSIYWIAPNQAAFTTTWNPLSSGGIYFWIGIYLPPSLFSNLPGNWQLQVYVNGQNLGETSFTVGTPAAQVAAVSSLAAQTCGTFSDRTNIYPCCANHGNCTWRVWYQAQINWGVNLHDWHFANQWWANAAKDGYNESSIPAVNTIAVNTTVKGTGHVAWVTQVNSDGSVLVSEMNCNLSPSQQYNKYYPPNWFTNGGGGFIYPKGTEGAPVITSMYPPSPTRSSTNAVWYLSGVNLDYPRSVSVTFPNGGHAILSGTGQIPFYAPTYIQLEMTLNATGWWSIQVVNYDGGVSAPYSFYVQ